jgi:hypothetical protein
MEWSGWSGRRLASMATVNDMLSRTIYLYLYLTIERQDTQAGAGLLGGASTAELAPLTKSSFIKDHAARREELAQHSKLFLVAAALQLERAGRASGRAMQPPGKK